MQPATGQSIVLIGGGGHARVVAEAAELAGFHIAGFLDDNREAQLAVQSPRYTWQSGLPGRERYLHWPWILALGDLAQRRRVLEGLGGRPESGSPEPMLMPLPVNVLHPRSFISPSAAVGLGVFVGPGAVVHACAAIGHHAIINTGAIVEHDCFIAENVHLAPGAVLGGNVQVGPGTLIGLGARVLPGIRIGAGCVVGAGAVVVKEVGDQEMVVGVPGRRKS